MDEHDYHFKRTHGYSIDEFYDDNEELDDGYDERDDRLEQQERDGER